MIRSKLFDNIILFIEVAFITYFIISIIKDRYIPFLIPLIGFVLALYLNLNRRSDVK